MTKKNKLPHTFWFGTTDIQKNHIYLRKAVRDKTGLEHGDTVFLIIVGTLNDSSNKIETLKTFEKLMSGKFKEINEL